MTSDLGYRRTQLPTHRAKQHSRARARGWERRKALLARKAASGKRVYMEAAA